MARKKIQRPKVSAEKLSSERAALKRTHRVTVLFNERELAQLDEYCRMCKTTSRSVLIRKMVIEKVLEALDENHPTLF